MMSSQELAWARSIASRARLSNAPVQPPLCERADSTPPRPDWTKIAEQFVETVGWSVREFVLVHSLLGQTRHVLLARWPLQERCP
jgi:hypothetical protein